MNHNGVLDYFGGTDNMSIFGSPDPIAEQFVVGSQEYQDAGMALDRQRGIGQVAKEQHPETQEIFNLLAFSAPERVGLKALLMSFSPSFSVN